VIIDAGHGGKDQGAVWYGVKEADLNLKVAKKVQTLLRAYKIESIMIRSTDKFVSLEDRTKVTNKYKDAIYVSIHFNAVPLKLRAVNGVETYYTSSEGKKIASLVHSGIVKTTGAKDRKIRENNKYKVLTGTKCPAILIECGYISNYSERQKCKSSYYQSLCAGGIVDGIVAYNKTK